VYFYATVYNCLDRYRYNFYSNTTQHTNQTIPISTKSLSSVGIKRAIQKGQASRCPLDYPFT